MLCLLLIIIRNYSISVLYCFIVTERCNLLKKHIFKPNQRNVSRFRGLNQACSVDSLPVKLIDPYIYQKKDICRLSRF